MTAVLSLVFFLSGAAALIFETLWFYQAGLSLGNTVWASSLVLSSFMGGLALGNGITGWLGHRVKRPIRLYAWLEALIGVTGVAIVLVLPRLTPAFVPMLRPLLDQPTALNALRCLIAFPLLLIPSTAMGATLPLLVGALCRNRHAFGPALGRLYGWNTLGAVVGAVAGECALFAWLGMRGAALAAAGLNGVAACLAWRLARRAEETVMPAEPPPAPVPWSTPLAALLLAAAVLGGTLLALEVVWFRVLLLFFPGSSLAFAIMLAAVLIGIGIGGLLASRWPAAHRQVDELLPTMCLATGLACALSYLLVMTLAGRLEIHVGLSRFRVPVLSGLLMIPASCCSGMVFTLLGQALHGRLAAASRSAGILALANTLGAMSGSLVAAFWFLPALGMELSVRVLAGMYGLAAALVVLAGARPSRGRSKLGLGIAAVSLAVVYALFPKQLMERSYMAVILRPFLDRAELPVAMREGLTETVVYLRRDEWGEPVSYRLMTDSVAMSATHTFSRRYMQLFAYLPLALHPQPRRALLICYGVGNTARALTSVRSLETIDVVDVSRDILELGEMVYADGDSPLRDPRVRVHVEDGRFFLQTTGQRFDLITGEPPPPQLAGVVSLYTREYFALMRRRLADGGMVTYWLPFDSLEPQAARVIVRAFCDVFQDCSLWTGAGPDWILMGSRDAPGPRDPARVAELWADTAAATELRAIGVEVPEQLGALFLADAEDLRSWIASAPPLTDDRPKRLSRRRPQRRENLPVYRPWMLPEGARERFARSRLIARLWPEALRETTLPYFQTQETVNQVLLGELGTIIDELPRVHALLTSTALETLPMWLLGSDPQSQRAAERAAARGLWAAELDAVLGLGALSRRQYALAAERLRSAQEHGAAQAELHLLRVYTLCMAGRLDEAGQLLAIAQKGPAEAHERFLRFLSETFGVPKA